MVAPQTISGRSFVVILRNASEYVLPTLLGLFTIGAALFAVRIYEGEGSAGGLPPRPALARAPRVEAAPIVSPNTASAPRLVIVAHQAQTADAWAAINDERNMRQSLGQADFAAWVVIAESDTEAALIRAVIMQQPEEGYVEIIDARGVLHR